MGVAAVARASLRAAVLCAAGAASLLGCQSGVPADLITDVGVDYDAGFWSAWSDGKAEVSTYRLARKRYGEDRTGTVVAIAVTEPWSKKNMVKDDKAQGPDRVDVMKLHTTTAFQTGIYDYHMATSAFVNLKPWGALSPGHAVKTAFSAQEWCGQVYHEVTNDGRMTVEMVRSYFADETDTRTLPQVDPLLTEDTLLLWARGLAGPRPDVTAVAFQPSLEKSRLDHKKLARLPATITRAVEGDVDVVVVNVAAVGDTAARTITLRVERTGARRVLSWLDSDGTSLTLEKSERLTYWQMNKNANAAERHALGIPDLLPLSTTPAAAVESP